MKINSIYLYGFQGGKNLTKLNLSPTINIEEYSDIDSIIKSTYEEFKSKHMDRSIRPKELLGKKLIMEFANWVEYKADLYWHLISLSENEWFNVFPCGNNLSSNICKENCLKKHRQITRTNGQVRTICVFRAIRVNWVIDIINLANKHDKRVRVWEKDNKLHLRYEYGEIDYIIIFGVKRNSYKLISAFPVFYINKKQTFNKDFNEFMQKKSQ